MLSRHATTKAALSGIIPIKREVNAIRSTVVDAHCLQSTVPFGLALPLPCSKEWSLRPKISWKPYSRNGSGTWVKLLPRRSRAALDKKQFKGGRTYFFLEVKGTTPCQREHHNKQRRNDGGDPAGSTACTAESKRKRERIKNIGGMNQLLIIHQCCIKATNKSTFLWSGFTKKESRFKFSDFIIPVSVILSESLVAYLQHYFGVCESIWKLGVKFYQATSCILERVGPEPALQFPLGWVASKPSSHSFSVLQFSDGCTSFP